jgi:cation transport ATPase
MLSITDPRLFTPGREASAASFARRLFSIREVRSITIDPSEANATVRYLASPGNQQKLVGRLADALQHCDDIGSKSMPVWRSGERVTLHMYGDIVTTLTILSLDSNRFEVRYRLVGRDPRIARGVCDAMAKIPGVLAADIAAGKLSLRIDPALISTLDLVRRVEAELLVPIDPHAAPATERVNFDLANVSLGVSTVGEFVVPAVMPLAAGLLVVSNVDTVRAATGQLSEGRVGLPLLYSGIFGLTLVTGQFLTAAVMLMFFRAWEYRYRRDMEVENQALLDQVVAVPDQALAISAGGEEQVVPRSNVEAGQRLRVRTGDRIPVDATVIAGAALVDEARLRGSLAPATRLKGDEVLAGSRIIAGELELSALRTGSETRAAQLSRALIGTTVPQPGKWALNQKAEKFADRTVGPSLIGAGFGYLLGGPLMSLAVMRPDYATAVGVTAPLESLRAVRIALRHGALLRSEEALTRLHASSWVVLDDHQALNSTDCELAEIKVDGIEEERLLPALAAAGLWLGDRRGPALVRACRARHLIARRAPLRQIGPSFIEIQYGKHVLRLSGQSARTRLMPLRVEVDGVEVARLRFQRATALPAASVVRRLQRSGLRVLLTSERKSSALAPLARRLGVDRYAAEFDAESRRRLLRDLSQRGVNAVHVHSGPVLRDSGDGHLSVALAGAEDTSWDDADMVLFGQSIDPLPALAGLAHDSITRTAGLRRWALAPNLACVAGAFAFGLSGFAVAFITNFGTSMVYNRAQRALRLASEDDVSPNETPWWTEDDAPPPE